MNGALIAILVALQIIFAMMISKVESDVDTQIKSTVDNRYRSNMSNHVERFKANIRAVLRSHQVNSVDLTKGLRCTLPGPAPKTPSQVCSAKAQSAATQLTQWQKHETPNGTVFSKVTGVSSADSPESYIDLQVCNKQNEAIQGHSLSMAKRFRIKVGNRAALANAVTGHKLACTFCHAQVYGNVVEYGPSSNDTPHNNWVFGKWLITGDRTSAKSATETANAPFKVLAEATPPDTPNTDFTLAEFDANSDSSVADNSTPGINRDDVFDYEHNYSGGEVLWHYQRLEKTLPQFDPTAMKNLVSGTIHGDIKVVPTGQSLSQAQAKASVTGIVQGNLILDGRRQPLKIDGNIMASGDVIILGFYKGKGSVFAGRNIYIPDDLKAINQAPLFNGSQPSNVELSQVSKAGQAEALANKYWNYDRLFLAATNNIVLGNPWPIQSKPTVIDTDAGPVPVLKSDITSDLKYMLQVQMDLFAGQFAYDKKTGWMVDVVDNGPGNPSCYLLPWESHETCVAFNSKEFYQRFQPTPLRIHPIKNHDKSRRQAGTIAPPAYTDNFLPKNVINPNTGELKLWISEHEYANSFRNIASYNLARAKMDHGRKRRYLNLLIPVPETGGPPGNPQLYQADDIYKALNKELKIANYAKKFSIPYTEYIEDKAVTYTGDQKLRRFLTDCIDYINGNKPTYDPLSKQAFANARYSQEGQWDNKCQGFKLSKKSEDRYENPNWPNFSWNSEGVGTLPSWPDFQAHCELWFKARPGDKGLADAAQVLSLYDGLMTKRKLSCSDFNSHNRLSPDLFFGGQRHSCYQTIAREPYQRFEQCKPGCQSGHNETAEDGSTQFVCDVQCSSSPPCSCGYECGDHPTDYVYTWPDRDSPEYAAPPPQKHKNPITGKVYNFTNFPFYDQQDAGSSDFYINIQKSHDSRPAMISIRTRVWPDSKDPELVRSKLSQIDGFLFANQFISYQTTASTDRTLEVNGGMIAKDLLGRYMSRLGFERDDLSTSQYEASGANWGASSQYVGTGIMVRLDPRIQFAEEFVYRDFGVIKAIDAPLEQCPEGD